MTDKNETVPQPTLSSSLKNATNIPANISSTTTATTTTTVVGDGGTYRHTSKCWSHSSSSSSPSSSHRRKKNREDLESGGIRHLLDKELVSYSSGIIPPSYQYQPHHLYQKQQSSSSSILGSSSSSDHHHNVTDADFVDGKASSHLHGKKHGRTSSHQQYHHLSGKVQSVMTGDTSSNLATGNEYRDNPVPTSDVQEAIRNLLTSVDTVSSASSSPPPSAHHQQRHYQTSRSSSSSPTRYTSHTSTTSSMGGTPKASHKKILPPSPIVVDSPSRTPRRKLDGVTSISGGNDGSMGAKSAPTYSCSPPLVLPHASSCPSPPSIGRYSGTSGSSGSLSMKKDDIVLPPTRSTASARARSCQNTSAITTVASSITGSVTTTSSSRPGPDSVKKTYSPFIQTTGGISKSSSRSASKDKSRDSSVDSDSGSVPNFYKTSQKLAEISDARPKYKASSGNNCRMASDSGGNKSSSIGNASSSNNNKKSGHHSHSQGVHSGGGGGVNSHKNSNYNRGYRSLEKENTGNYGGYVTGYSNTIGSCGLGVDQRTSQDKDKTDHNYHHHHHQQQQQQQNQSADGKSTRSSKDHVYYTADRPSRRNMPTTGGSSHRASSVPARRSMSVSEFAGTSVDPEPGNGQSDGENLEKVKSKLMSMWNNVKYGWTLNRKTSFRYDSPIFLLGEHYHRRHDDEMDGKNKEDSRNCVNNMELFKLDFASRLWFTYRRDFEPLKGTKLTTDCGWGCMIRSGQMMLAQAFITHFFGRSWRIQNRDRGLNVYRQIIKWFADYQQCPFSVHQLVEIGSTLGRKPGEWYGPATVATMLREAMERSYEYQPVLRELCVYVASDCTVYLQEVADLCMSGNNNTLVKMPNGSDAEDASVDASVDMPESGTAGSWKRAVIVLIPVRLGGESLNSVYIPCLQNLLAEEHCIGIIGGKPKHSLYFVGWQDKKLIYLDPHYCQDNVDVMSGDFTFSSFHCITPRKLPFEDMDPSCTIGFYCRNQEEFEKFVNQTRDLATNPKQKGLYPAFAFVDGRSCDLQMDKLELNKERYLRIRYVDQDGKQKLPVNENDDFVVL